MGTDMLTHVQNCSSTYSVCFSHMSALNIHDIVGLCGALCYSFIRSAKVCYVFMPTSFAFCVLVYLPLHAQFASDDDGRMGRGVKRGKREPFGAAINVAAKWQCHARLGPLCPLFPPNRTAPNRKKPPNEDIRLKGCVRRWRRHGHEVASAWRTGEVRLSPNRSPRMVQVGYAFAYFISNY